MAVFYLARPDNLQWHGVHHGETPPVGYVVVPTPAPGIWYRWDQGINDWVHDPELEPVPYELTPSQFHTIMALEGLSDIVRTKIDELPEPNRTIALMKLDKGLVFERNHPLISTLGSAMGLTEAQIDAMFRAGKNLPE